MQPSSGGMTMGMADARPTPADVATPGPRTFDELLPDPCAAMVTLFQSCGVAIRADYLDICRMNFGGTAPNNQAYKCKTRCEYGSTTDACAAVKARFDSNQCTTCCAPVVFGGQPTCGQQQPDAAPPAPDMSVPIDEPARPDASSCKANEQRCGTNQECCSGCCLEVEGEIRFCRATGCG
jgi:hypothetical protein